MMRKELPSSIPKIMLKLESETTKRSEQENKHTKAQRVLGCACVLSIHIMTMHGVFIKVNAILEYISTTHHGLLYHALFC